MMAGSRADEGEEQEHLESGMLALQQAEQALDPDRVEGARLVVHNREERNVCDDYHFF